MILDRLGGDRAAWAVAAVAFLLVIAIVTLHRRFLVALPVAMIVLLIGSSAVASNNLADRVAYDQHNLVGTPPNWIIRATHAPTAYFYDGESYWNGVWQVRFWNRNVDDVVAAAPARVPGADVAAGRPRPGDGTAADPRTLRRRERPALVRRHPRGASGRNSGSTRPG